MIKIVIIEDNAADAKILRLALSRLDRGIETVVLEDGARALEFFGKNAEAWRCDLIILDLNLPRVSGFDVLEFLKSGADLKSTPVVILSGSRSQQDVQRCYTLGANSYICKPTGIEQVFSMAAHIIEYWFDCAELPRAASAVAR